MKYPQKISEQGQKFVPKENMSLNNHHLTWFSFFLHVINVNIHI